MKQWYGGDMAGYQLDEEASNRNSSILFRKMVDGIPFLNDTLNFAINSEGQIQHLARGDGYVESVEIEQDISKIQFADPNKVYAKEKVEAMFAHAMTPYYGQSADGQSYRFLYTPSLEEINASIGAELPAKQNNKTIQFQPKAKQTIVKSKEEAAAFLATKTGYNPTKGRATFQEESDPKTGIRNYLWMTEDEVIANIFFETKTGKVTNYQVLDRKRKSEVDKKLSEEQAIKAAVEARRSTGFPSWIILIKCRLSWLAGLLPSLRATFRIYLGYRRIRQQRRSPRKRHLIYLCSHARLELVYLPAEKGAEPALAYQIRRDSEQPWAIEATTDKIIN